MITSRLLLQDAETFREEYKDACFFLLAASLRCECFTIYGRKHQSEWDKNRLKELLTSPACQEKWFLNLIGEN